jgi:hypothetical protein
VARLQMFAQSEEAPIRKQKQLFVLPYTDI